MASAWLVQAPVQPSGCRQVRKLTHVPTLCDLLPCNLPQFDGIHPEALAVTIDTWGLEKMKGKREWRRAPGRGAKLAPARMRQLLCLWISVPLALLMCLCRGPPPRTHTHAHTHHYNINSTPSHLAAAYPPTVFASMLRDKDMALKIAAAWRELHSMNSPVEVIGVRAMAAMLP